MGSQAQVESNDSTLSSDEIHELLSNSRRRQTIHVMKRDDGTADLSTLAEEVAAWENDKPVAEVTSDERHLVYTSIQQNHIPQMERAGVITHQRGELELTDEAEELDIYMDIVPKNSIPWGEYYLGLSAFSLALVAAVWVGVFPASIPDLAWAALIGMLFLCSAAYHVYRSREMLLGDDEKPPEFRS
ncbi:hypothetical protein GLW36_12650 [Halorubrum terrestre]|uniref:DUF7344 domain-containing protein n=1 Tax=Halorubrum distributum TaxID=29283 RepID=A0A6B1IFT3_9EURY|nr:hypothetical protein [Halorubrum terrestre]MYL17488.1 hypothetical protein [Halorubrum terrestre]